MSTIDELKRQYDLDALEVSEQGFYIHCSRTLSFDEANELLAEIKVLSEVKETSDV